MERKRGTFKVKLSEAPIRCPIEQSADRLTVFFVP